MPRATWVNTLPSIGEAFSKYWPSAGATHSPPMKFSYLGAKVTALPSVPGAAYFAIACSCRYRYQPCDVRYTRVGSADTARQPRGQSTSWVQRNTAAVSLPSRAAPRKFVFSSTVVHPDAPSGNEARHP
ncbi:Uncharacterised protein [Mycobacteroides abscessus subsp. abscessus]|nr:Uncharacterised protein [Mycobacteroides abscessus subsp. abscessus]